MSNLETGFPTKDVPRMFSVSGMADGSERYEIEITGPVRSKKLRNVIRMLTFYAEMIEADELAEKQEAINNAK